MVFNTFTTSLQEIAPPAHSTQFSNSGSIKQDNIISPDLGHDVLQFSQFPLSRLLLNATEDHATSSRPQNNHCAN